MPKKTESNKQELMEAYDKISLKYGKVKTKPWKDFRSYYEEIGDRFPLPTKGLLLDVGSGNGRNLLVFEEKEWEFIASDLSLTLLKKLVALPKEKTHIINNDVSLIPIKNNTIDLGLCIAVVHHLSSDKEVEETIERVYSVLKPEGYLIISCWRKWKSDTIGKMIKDLILFCFKKIMNKKWRHGDIFIPWYDNMRKIVAERYYHLFSRREILKIVRRSKFEVEDFKLHGGKNNKDNFFFLLKKRII